MRQTPAAFIYDDTMSKHVLSPSHPMQPTRLRYTYELASSYGLIDSTLLQEPRLASEAEILQFHSDTYVNATRRLSQGDITLQPSLFGFGSGDNPVYPGMYDAAILSTGGSMKGIDLLLSGQVNVAFNISGGLHHAMPAYTSGFCIFNDPVIAIMELLRKGKKVAYVDIDCHHGDGVQHAFYDTSDVLTISLHESGEFLFPGTGFTEEIGTGSGQGYSVNVPLFPYTSDKAYLWAFQQVVPPLIEAYQPDVLVTQLGVDSHYHDPITHLALTVQGFSSVVSEFVGMAPMWLATGGGGYDLEAVARAWTSAWSIMSERKLADDIPTSYHSNHSVSKLNDHQELPDMVIASQDQAQAFAELSVKAIHNLIFPIIGAASP